MSKETRYKQLTLPGSCLLTDFLTESQAVTYQGSLNWQKESYFQALASPRFASAGSLTFIWDENELRHCSGGAKGIVVTSTPELYKSESSAVVLKVPDAKAVLLDVLTKIKKKFFIEQGLFEAPDWAQHQTRVHPSATLEPGVLLGAGVTIAEGAFVGAGTVIRDSCQLGAGVSIGAHCSLQPRVSIGAHSRVQSHVALGEAGFGFWHNSQGQSQLFPHLAGVYIGKRCFIGAHTSIAAGILSPTWIEDDAILDSQVLIAHNVVIGQGTAIAGATAIAGSTQIDEYCQIGGGSCIAGHLNIGARTMIAGMTAVTRSLPGNQVYCGCWPALPLKNWHRLVATSRQLAHQ